MSTLAEPQKAATDDHGRASRDQCLDSAGGYWTALQGNPYIRDAQTVGGIAHYTWAGSYQPVQPYKISFPRQTDRPEMVRRSGPCSKDRTSSTGYSIYTWVMRSRPSLRSRSAARP